MRKILMIIAPLLLAGCSFFKSSKDIEVTSDKTVHVKSEKITIEASDKIEIKAQTISIEASQSLKAKGMEVSIEGSTSTTVKASGKMELNGGGMMDVKAGLVKIN